MVKVSVIIPVYKTAKYIRETLESVFAQSFKDFEVIVINDDSPDSDELERALTPFLERIMYLKQDNGGPGRARNTGIRHARGEYVAFLDSDDRWLPEYLASQMALFEDTPSLDLVYCDAQHVGDPALAGKTYMDTCPSKGPVTLESLIKVECQVICSCTVARKRVIEDAGLFDERLELRGCEDYDLWLRIRYRGGRIAYQRKVLARYRSRPGSLSRDTIQMCKSLVLVYEKAERAFQLREETRTTLKNRVAEARARVALEVGRSFLAARDFDRARESLIKANQFFHRTKLTLAIFGLQVAPRWTRLVVTTRQKIVLGSEPVK